MKIIKKALRLFAMILFVVLVSFGAGIMPIFPGSRERFHEKPVTIENVEKREDENDFEEGDQIKC